MRKILSCNFLLLWVFSHQIFDFSAVLQHKVVHYSRSERQINSQLCSLSRLFRDMCCELLLIKMDCVLEEAKYLTATGSTHVKDPSNMKLSNDKLGNSKQIKVTRRPVYPIQALKNE